MSINEENDACGECSSFEQVAGPGCEHPTATLVSKSLPDR